AAVRNAIRSVAGDNVVTAAHTLDSVLESSGREILISTYPLVPLIATGMLLTAAGIYGVLAFAIARRSKELAIRVAIGATQRDVVRLVAAHSVRLVAAGTILGIGATFGLTRIVRATGGAGSVFDPEWDAFLVPALIIATVGALATW